MWTCANRRSRSRWRRTMVVGVALTLAPHGAHARQARDGQQPADVKSPKPKVSKLFKSETPLEVTLTANYKTLRREKRDGSPYHAAVLSYIDSGAKGAHRIEIPVRVRTRGIWRLANCDFPPLRLNFANKTSKNTLFDDLDEPKLVSYCKSANADRLVLQEHQLYRVLSALTPISHQTRLLRMAYADSATGAVEFTRYAILVEDPARMAERVGGKMLTQKGGGPEDFSPLHTAMMFLYQYMVGNTDFSFSALHNGEVVSMSDGQMYPVAYDFDFAGAINAPYAKPAPQLRIKSVRERQFRGYCAFKGTYPSAITFLQSKKPAIYALYSDAIGALLDRKTATETLEYFDAFYRDIETPKTFERNVLSDCSDAK